MSPEEHAEIQRRAAEIRQIWPCALAAIGRISPSIRAALRDVTVQAAQGTAVVLGHPQRHVATRLNLPAASRVILDGLEMTFGGDWSVHVVHTSPARQETA